MFIPQDINGKELSKHLLGFENFINKKFKGEFYNSTKENPLIDVIYFERGGKTSPPFDSINLKTGDKMREDWFPKVFSN